MSASLSRHDKSNVGDHYAGACDACRIANAHDVTVTSPSEVIQFPARSTAELAAQNSDRLLRENAVGWVEHFAMYGEGEVPEGIYRFVCRVKLRMERERGFGKK